MVSIIAYKYLMSKHQIVNSAKLTPLEPFTGRPTPSILLDPES